MKSSRWRSLSCRPKHELSRNWTWSIWRLGRGQHWGGHDFTYSFLQETKIPAFLTPEWGLLSERAHAICYHRRLLVREILCDCVGLACRFPEVHQLSARSCKRRRSTGTCTRTCGWLDSLSGKKGRCHLQMPQWCLVLPTKPWNRCRANNKRM